MSFLEEKSITPLKKWRYELSTHYKHFLANFGYVWACISITDHNRPVKVCISITDHNNTSESYYILYFNMNYTTIPYKMCNLILACSSQFEWSNAYRVWVLGVQTLLVTWAAIKMIKKYRTLKNQQWRYVFVFGMSSNPCERLSWQWSYGSWIYNYLCNQCLSTGARCIRKKTNYIIQQGEELTCLHFFKWSC